jgi:hypothetical protein
MRIVIEVNEAEARYTTVREEGSGMSATIAPAKDGGPPPSDLLLALGESAVTTVPGSPVAGSWVAGSSRGKDAGSAPTWLVDVISGESRGR